MDKENVVICHGHLYLFWSAGVYYTRELAENYNVILYVAEYYRHNQRFLTICQTIGITDIVYYDNKIANPFAQQSHYCSLARQVVEKYKPVSVFQNDYIGHENMYLFHWAKKLCPKVSRIVILTSWASGENTKNNLRVFREHRAEEYSQKYFLPKSLVLLLVKLVKNVSSVLTNKLYPVLLLKETPYYTLSEHSNIDILLHKPLFDYFLVYNQAELDYQEKLFGQAGPFKLIQCPIVDRYDINKVIYNTREKDVVTIFPSLIGLYGIEVERNVLERWAEGLNNICAQLPEYTFIMKIHPGYNVTYTQQLTGFFGERCPFLSFVNTGFCAEELMLESRLVLGDVSSTLWWSNFIKTKTVISLDMHNYPGSGDMRRYGGIIYIDDVEKIKALDIGELIEQRRDCVEMESSDLPYLTEFV